MTLHTPMAHTGWIARLVRGLRGVGDRNALNALEPHDRSRVLSDARIGENDVGAVLHAGHVDELLPAALVLHGVDAAALDHDRRDLVQDMQRVCAHCHETRACRHLLAEGASREAHARVCLNAGTLDALR